ncbi:small CPxCG-related zinc finger protein (plasmid) [Halobacterium hubeiense]|uniref:Small CPxCG-related zinc finger protein n=1 Tax=Halobacterium hubeiense TaxID=1407499 RepID=A0A0U5D2A2_9EURY|nr:small CPxCG-related zinc finger protein [Halobacterium hubeiense]
MANSSSDIRVTCRECYEPISVDAKECPHCGYNPRRNFQILAVVSVFIFGFFAIIAGFLAPFAVNIFAVLAVITPILFLLVAQNANPARKTA